MKPCNQNRKPIAWLALDALDQQSAHDLRRHLEGCEGCRSYLEELTDVVEKLEMAEYKGSIAVPESFYRKLATRLSAPERASVPETILALLRANALSWRIAVTVMAVVGLAISGFFLFTRNANVSPGGQARTQPLTLAGQEFNLPPTIANYQIVASDSLEKLDALLTRQGGRTTSPGPLYTASALALENGVE